MRKTYAGIMPLSQRGNASLKNTLANYEHTFKCFSITNDY